MANASGTIVGWTDFAPEEAPHVQAVGFHWTPGTGMQPLAFQPDWQFSTALSINNQGIIVGTARGIGDELGQAAILWDDHGTVHLVNNLLQDAEGWQLTEAREIHNDGRILATGFYQGQFRGVVLHPVQEPEPEPIPPPSRN